jgi:FecR protein
MPLTIALTSLTLYLKEVIMKPLCVAVFAVTLFAVFSMPVAAQPVISAKSGLLSYVEGQVKLNDQPVEFSTTRFADVKENSIVTTLDGRAEVLLTPGVTLRMGENSSLRMITNRLVDTRVELLTGSAVVEADMISKDTSVTVVVQQGSVALPKAGLYRFDAAPAEVKVFKGDAEVEIAGQTKVVSSAHMLSLATETASIEKFDTEDTDALDRWSHRRGSYLAMANTSAARSLVSSGSVPYTWGMMGCSSAWGYNNYYGMMTFIPCTGSLWSPYGYRFWSPYSIRGAYWVNPPVLYGGGAGRTGVSSSGAASLARPATTASYRSTSAASGLGSSHAGFANSGSNVASGGNGSVSSSARSGGGSSSSGGFSGASSSGGGHAGGGGGGAGGHK